jgi:hypothetical protein
MPGIKERPLVNIGLWLIALYLAALSPLPEVTVHEIQTVPDILNED